MPVVFLCQNCRSRLKVGRKKIGTEVECPRCRQPLTVPEPEAAAAMPALADVERPKVSADLFPEFAVFDDPLPPPPPIPSPSSPTNSSPASAPPPPPPTAKLPSTKSTRGPVHSAQSNGDSSADTLTAPRRAGAAGAKPSRDRAEGNAAQRERLESAGSVDPPARTQAPLTEKPTRRPRSTAGSALGVLKRDDQPSSYSDVLTIRRRTLYFQAALILLMAAVGLALGYLIGRGIGPAERGASGRDADVQIAGTLTFRDARGEETPDSGAVVIALPAEIPPNRLGTLLVTGLGPLAPREAGRVAEMAIEELGGKYDRSDALGNFVLKLPEPGSYRLLLVSRNAQRPAGEVVTAAQLREMQRYFNAPADLIGRNKYAWALRDVRDPRLTVLHTF